MRAIAQHRSMLRGRSLCSALLLVSGCADAASAGDASSTGLAAPGSSTAPSESSGVPGESTGVPLGGGEAADSSSSGVGGGSSTGVGLGTTTDGSSSDGSARFDVGVGSSDVAVDISPPFERIPLVMAHDVVFGIYGPGEAWADMDGDGWLDLLTVGGAAASELWHNDGGELEHSPLEADLAGVLDTAGVTLADYDNDGDPDVYLLRKGPNVLLRNDDGLALVDVSVAAGVAYDGEPSSSSWGDFDNDGWLDLYLCTMGAATDVLYRNQGDGTFVDRSDLLVGLAGAQAFAASFSDYDDDGDLDLYVINDKFAINRMWRNDGAGCGDWCFTEVGSLWGVAAVVEGMGLAVGDFDNDLDLDLAFSDVDTLDIFQQTDPDAPMFTDVSAAMGVVYPAHGWGTVFLDYDNDGWLDLYVADSELPEANSRMFHNDAGTGFTDVSTTCDCVDVGWNFGVARADYDQDGGEDFVVGQRSLGHALYRNTAATGRHWLEVELEGGGPINRDAVGARVLLTTTDGTVLRRDVEIGTGVASQSSLRLHFGLGAAEPMSIEIRWPDGTVESPPVPAVDTLWLHAYPG